MDVKTGTPTNALIFYFQKEDKVQIGQYGLMIVWFLTAKKVISMHKMVVLFYINSNTTFRNENSFRKHVKNMKNNSEKYIYFLAMKQSIFIIMSMLHFS